jgi:cation:H+ antiporter
LFVLGWTMLLVGSMGAGLVRRERSGIGFEGIAILALYFAGLATISVMG